MTARASTRDVVALAAWLSLLVGCGSGHRTNAVDASPRDAASEQASTVFQDAATDVPGADVSTGSQCAPPTPNLCGSACVDVQSDPMNCGGCTVRCSLPGADAGCAQGQCTVLSCIGTQADCMAEPGCETPLGTADNCAACGDHGCMLANTMLTCQGADGCKRAVCEPGFANCDTTTSDCETSLSAGGACLPTDLGTTTTPADILDVGTVIGTDGSYFIAGSFRGTVDFDPTSGQDIKSTTAPAGIGSFITKINADGSYGWTQVFPDSNVGVNGISGGLAAAAGGAVVLVGGFVGQAGPVDLDPGPGVDLHQPASTTDQEGAILKLAADGSFVWGRVFASAGPVGGIAAASDLEGIAVDTADSVYVAGQFQSAVDFDPGPGTAIRASTQTFAAMMVKLTSGGDLAWVQAIDDGPCMARLAGVAVASDGAIWSEGIAGVGGTCTLGSPSGTATPYASIVATFDPGGDAPFVHVLAGGSGSIVATTIAPGLDGSVYVGGHASGVVDFGAGTGVRQILPLSLGGGFIVKLAPDASVLWAEGVNVHEIISVAATPDGGVLGSGLGSNLVTRIGPDGTPRWTLQVPNGDQPTVATRGSSFDVASFGETGNLFLSRFAF